MSARIPLLRPLQARLASAQAKAKESAQPRLAPEKPQLTTLPTGVQLATVENHQPVSRIVVALKAGSRYEPADQLGLTHCLRNCAGLATKSASWFGITRNLTQLGASLSATTTRDHIIYTLECIRDNLDTGLKYLSQVTTRQVFKHWEVDDYAPRMKLDLALLHEQPQQQVLEALHKAAYRSSLAFSLYSPPHMIQEHEAEWLRQFVQKHFTSNRMAIVGVGVDHEFLSDYANRLFQLDSGAGPAIQPPKYAGGEVRIDAHAPQTHVAVASEGAGLSNLKEAVALAIVKQVLGSGPRTPGSGVSGGSRLAQLAAQATERPHVVSGINFNYSDTGLIGFYIAANPKDVGKILRAAYGQFNSYVTSGVKDADLKNAKHSLKASVALTLENSTALAEQLAVHALVNGKIADLAELNAVIDSVTSADVSAVLKKAVGKKPAMASVGDLSATPFLDELL